MTRASLAAFKRTVTVDWPAGQAEEGKALLIRTAKEGHAEILRDQRTRSGITPDFEAFANAPGRPVEAVDLPGPIVYRYAYLREVVTAALEALRDASPIVSGDYRRGHTLFVNGVPFDHVPRFEPDDDIMIANRVPYARRLEVGKTESGRAFVIQVPPKIYERTAKLLRRRFGNVAVITVSIATLPEAHIIRGKLAPSYAIGGGKRRNRQQKRHIGKPVQSPALVFRAA